MALPPVIISDFAPDGTRPASTAPAGGDVPPWIRLLSDQERADMEGFAVVIWPDRPITRRLTRHVLTTPTGHKFAALMTIEECWQWAEAHELSPVGLSVGDRVITLNPVPSRRPLSIGVG